MNINIYLYSGSVGNVVEGGIDTYNAYNDYNSGNYLGASVDAGVHFGEAIGEGFIGNDYWKLKNKISI